MSAPAQPTDSKSASLLQPTSEEAPPIYSETSGSTIVVGDGNVFSDIPRPGAMNYGPGNRQSYVPRAERKGTWNFSLFDCFSDPGASRAPPSTPLLSLMVTLELLANPSPAQLPRLAAAHVSPTGKPATAFTPQAPTRPSSLLPVSATA